MIRLRLAALLLSSALLCVHPALAASQPPSKPDVIKDRYGRTLGSIRTGSNGRLEARDRYGRLLGYYDAKRNETRDSYGRLLTKNGNVLAALIMKAAEKK